MTIAESLKFDSDRRYTLDLLASSPQPQSQIEC
jgi:hypothetical protein